MGKKPKGLKWKKYEKKYFPKERKARITKDKRKKNATFEGPKKNSGSDMRLAKNKERRSI